MAADDLAVCNMALAKIGHDAQVSLTGSTKILNLLNTFYPSSRDAVLVSHPWNAAMKRATLTLGGIASATIVDGGAGGTPGATTITGTTGEGTFFEATGTIDGGGVLTGSLVITVAGAYTVLPTDTAAEPVTSDDIDGVTVALSLVTPQPLWDWDYAYDLPEDCLRVWRVREAVRGARGQPTPWAVEGRQLLTNLGAPRDILYIRRLTDTTLFPPLLDLTIATYLAGELAMPVAQSQALKDGLAKEFLALLRRARSADAQEGTPEPVRADELLDAMRV